MSASEDTQIVDLITVYADAIDMLPRLWREAQAAGRDPTNLVLELTDSAGAILLSVPFTDLQEHDRQRH